MQHKGFLTRYGTQMLKITIPAVIVLLILNTIMILYFVKSHNQTTLIFSEVYNKNSDGTSSSDTKHVNNVDNAKAAIHGGVDANGERMKAPEEGNKNLSKDNAELTDENAQGVDDIDNELGLANEIIDSMIEKLKQNKIRPFFPSYFWEIKFANLTRKLGRAARIAAKTLSGYQTPKYKVDSMDELANWKVFHRHINQYALYDSDDPAVTGLLDDLRNLPIEEIDENEGGTEIKLNVRFSDGGRAVLKPQRNPRERQANPNHYVFDDMERHHAEIAASRLDSVLGFNRVPPTVGRWVNLTAIKPLTPKVIYKTFYKSPVGNVCFFGKCDYYCDSRHPVCGAPDMIEASIMSYLPSRNIASRHSWYQPWRRSYSKFHKAEWYTDDRYCDTIRKEAPFNNGKVLLDMIDVHTFDFITGNKDRHSFAFFKDWGNYSFPILYDNGRGFGFTDLDHQSILMPLRQCCMLRKSTFLKYVKLYVGPERLSLLMKAALKDDLVAPVLLNGFYKAMDRRVMIILKHVAECVLKYPVNNVIIQDRF